QLCGRLSRGESTTATLGDRSGGFLPFDRRDSGDAKPTRKGIGDSPARVPTLRKIPILAETWTRLRPGGAQAMVPVAYSGR
ncbi:MAG TPA: hypothetical protein VKF62_05275, partial [Planctomycetota bacterium]|nr:hypothetical protein [Planctomycetota bacterium]